MFTTFPRKILFALSALLLAGVVTVVVSAGQQAEWQIYQQRYFDQTSQPLDRPGAGLSHPVRRRPLEL